MNFFKRKKKEVKEEPQLFDAFLVAVAKFPERVNFVFSSKTIFDFTFKVTLNDIDVMFASDHIFNHHATLMANGLSVSLTREQQKKLYSTMYLIKHNLPIDTTTLSSDQLWEKIRMSA
jgi:hypothetical protein